MLGTLTFIEVATFTSGTLTDKLGAAIVTEGAVIYMDGIATFTSGIFT
jgi:hypothetical protein